MNKTAPELQIGFSVRLQDTDSWEEACYLNLFDEMLQAGCNAVEVQASIGYELPEALAKKNQEVRLRRRTRSRNN